MKISVTTKLYGMTAIMLFCLVAVSTLSIIVFQILQERDDIRNVEIQFLQARQGDLDFSIFKSLKFSRRVDSAVVICDSILQQHAGEELTDTLQKAIHLYKVRFDSIVTVSTVLGLNDSTGIVGKFAETWLMLTKELTKSQMRELSTLAQLYQTKSRSFTDTHNAINTDYVVKDIDSVIIIIKTQMNTRKVSFSNDSTLQYLAQCQKILTEIVAIKQQLQTLGLGLKKDIVAIRPLLKDIVAQKNNLSLTYSVIAVVIIILSATICGVVVVGFNRIIARPLKSLFLAVQANSQGNIHTKLPIQSDDEFGKIAIAFNQMIEHILLTMRALEGEKNTVQQRVDEAIQQSEREKMFLEHNIEYMLHEVENLEQGNLSIHFYTEDVHEIGRLYTGLNKALQHIAEMILEVQNAIYSTRQAGLEISDKTLRISDFIQTQLTLTQTLVERIDQINRAITQNSSRAAESNQQAYQTNQDATAAGNILQNTILEMSTIDLVVSDAANVIEKLFHRSEEIGSIIQVIEEIADQTNLLALNAAIEAARAGEQGRGFSVVADEVRKLAERTQQATKQITQMIDTIQSGTSEALQTMQHGKEKVQTGTTLTLQAGNALERIITRTRDVSDSIATIVSENNLQLHDSRAIKDEIQAMSERTKILVNSVIQIEGTTKSLSEHTNKLEELIQHFNVHRRM